MTFNSSPTLGNVRFFLQIITEELREYQIWPVSECKVSVVPKSIDANSLTQQNCYFLCSLLQEHLEIACNGRFTLGNILHINLAVKVRSTIHDRVYHIPQPPPDTVCCHFQLPFMLAEY